MSDASTGSPMRIVAVMQDLMLLSRIDAAATVAGAVLSRVDAPAEVGQAELVLVDWSARDASWGPELARWRSAHDARIVLFGRHTDLEAHAAAKAAGLGPMWARSKLIAELAALCAPPH